LISRSLYHALADALPAPLAGEAGCPWGLGALIPQEAGSPSKPLFYPRNMQLTMAFILREQEVAARLRVSVSTLRRMRQRGTGPEWVGIGKQIRYPIGGAGRLEAWIGANLGRTLPKHWRAVGER